MDIKKLEKYINSHENVVIGIDGPSGSGKTYLSNYLEEKYDTTVIHIDDYFLPKERKTELRLKEPGGNIDYERCEKEVFHHINDQFIPSNKYNCTTNKLMTREPLLRKKVVIIEGVYALHPRFRPYYDYTVFMDISPDKQLERILRRSNEKMLNRFINEWIPLEDAYFEALSLRSNVDLLVKNYQE